MWERLHAAVSAISRVHASASKVCRAARTPDACFERVTGDSTRGHLRVETLVAEGFRCKCSAAVFSAAALSGCGIWVPGWGSLHSEPRSTDARRAKVRRAEPWRSNS